MNQDLRVRLATGDHYLQPWELIFSFARSSGKGGQNVNKTESKAILEFYIIQSSLPADVKDRFLQRYGSKLSTDHCLRIASDEHRDRDQNIREVLSRLRQMIESVAIPPKTRRKTRPTRSSVKKRLETKRRHGEVKKSRSGNWDD